MAKTNKAKPAKKQDDITVEKNVDIEKFPKPKRRSKFPWPFMKTGDSFEIEAEEEIRSKKASELAAAGNAWAKRNDFDAKFEARVSDKGVRVWRIA